MMRVCKSWLSQVFPINPVVRSEISLGIHFIHILKITSDSDCIQALEFKVCTESALSSKHLRFLSSLQLMIDNYISVASTYMISYHLELSH